MSSPTVLTLSRFFILAAFSIHNLHGLVNDCVIGGVDLSALDQDGGWISKSSDRNVTYEISLCKPLNANGPSIPSCHGSTSVCAKMKNGTIISLANFSASGLMGQVNNKSGEMWIIAQGDRCLELPDENMTTIINFKCGKTIGYPKFLDYYGCITTFEWETSLYCKSIPVPNKEVKCYLYDRQTEDLYDLSPLAKQSGAYLVDSENQREIYINVCRDITGNTESTSKCPSGAGACRVVNGTAVNLGSPTQQLKESTNGRLMLRYTTPAAVPSEGCTVSPSTTINFICPKEGGSKDPLLLSDFNCQLEIEWQTDYACAESTLTNNTCILTKENSNIAIDLTPLKKEEGSKDPYKVSYTEPSGDTYDYFVNICNGLDIQCPDEQHKVNVSACQTKPSKSGFGKIMGKTDRMTLKYADDELSATFKGGDLCHHNNAQRSTIIIFQCNMTAGNDGHGYPVFVRADSDFCVYYFEWQTKYACLESPMCRIDYNNKRFDLSSLSRREGTNWEALHQTTDTDGGTGTYFVNVCHNVLAEGTATGCDPTSSLCYKDGSTVRNLGHYRSAPTYDPAKGEITLVYADGGPCNNNGQTQSTIRFTCKPGNAETAPSLVSVTPDKCRYEFEWYTSAACVLGQYTGKDCKVYDTEAGFSFDLSPLRKPDGQYYTVADDSSSYNFLINVCGPVMCTGSDSAKPGICQVSTDNTHSYVTGQWSDTLHYFDGLISLTYSNGDQYNDPQHTARQSKIAFLCDPTAGIGSPQYLSELKNEHTYSFEWHTAYACPKQQIECTATDPATHQQYDLSSLAKPGEVGNWNRDGNSESGVRNKYYINVCRPVAPVSVGKGCSPSASVCRTKFVEGQETMDIDDLGEMKDPLVVESVGRLKLTYTSPPTCNNGTHNVSYVTTIEFVCEKNALVSQPTFPAKDGPCQYNILWLTAEACPLGGEGNKTESNDCQLKDPNTGYTFNLQPLRKKGNEVYTTRNGTDGITFKLNICGSVPESVCPKLKDGSISSVCFIENNGLKTSLAQVNSDLQFSELGFPVLVSDGIRLVNGERVNVQIRFICSYDVDIGEPTFFKKYEHTYYFEFITSLVCRPEPVDCFLQDKKGNQYDLNALSRFNYWDVMDTRDGHTDIRYYINVCRPVNQAPVACPTGPVGGCQVTDGQAYNLGYIHSKPVVYDDGTIAIHYRDGDVCHKGTDKESHRSTRVNFYCSQTEGSPTFFDETATCEYVFNWFTPAACPLQSNVGSNCTVVEPLYHYKFDLNPLRKVGDNYHVKQGDYDYVLNLCGPLEGHGMCGAGTQVAACQTKPGDSSYTPMVAGMTNRTLVYNSGEIILTYSGGKDKCHGKYERQTVITFRCHQEESGSKGPQFLEESENCHYRFLWETMYACPPMAMGGCGVTSPSGDQYDLSSLALPSANYEFVDSVNKKKYLFNVCKSLTFQKGALCPGKAAVCMVDLNTTDERKKYHNIGVPNTKEVRFENNRLVLFYDSGEVCNNGTHNVTTTTTIVFDCNKNAYNTQPSGHFFVGDGNCNHHFVWSSHAACPVDNTPGPGVNETCTLVSPKTGYAFDLTPLKILSDQAWRITDDSGHEYDFNVCGPVKGTPCSDKAPEMGMCQFEKLGEKRRYNAGNANARLQYNDGVVYLNYSGGEKCHSDKFERNTIISFVCDRTAGHGQPVLVGESDECTYYVNWLTSLACEESIKCSVDIGDKVTIDLSPLSQTPTHLVEMVDPGETMYLSVCRPLNPIQGTLCPPGSSVCQVKNGEQPRSLGRLRQAPTATKSGEVTLVYDHGSKCDVNTTQNFSSQIAFKCQKGVREGNPVFLQKLGCQYEFEWSTGVVCYDESVPTPEPNFCGYYDAQQGRTIDLNVLHKSDGYRVKHGLNNFIINMCGPAKNNSQHGACGHAMVCDDRGTSEISYGEPKNIKFVKEESMVKVTYAFGEGKCPGGQTAQSHIMLECDYNHGLGNPEVFYEQDCYVVFKWKTSFVCPPQTCNLVSNGQQYDLSLLQRDTGAWKVPSSDGNTYWINVCSAIKSGEGSKGPCSNMAAACRQGKDGQTDLIGSATAQQLSMEGDVIKLEYGQGSPACSKDRRRSDNNAAKTVIRFICDHKSVRGPVFSPSSNSGNCVYEFEWKTRLACPISKEVVVDTNGVIYDNRSGDVIDLNAFKKLSPDLKQTKQSGNTIYKITLDGSSTECAEGVICQITGTTSRLLGTFPSRKYILQDDVLEATYTTREQCKKSPLNTVSSIIRFQCGLTNKTFQPVLLNSYKDCLYVFYWESSIACIRPQIVTPPPGAGGDNAGGGGAAAVSAGGGTKGGTVGAIVGVFLAAIVICVLLVVFHKADRRAAVMTRLRQLVGHKSSDYTQLPQDTTDDLEVIEEDILNFGSAPELEQNREDQPINVHVTPTYHDDSDEDMLA